MAKVTITFEADSWDEARTALTMTINDIHGPTQNSVAMTSEDFPPFTTADLGPASEPTLTPAPAPEPEPAPAPEPKKATKPKPTPAKAPAIPLREIPPLDALKGAITAAVRAAQNNGGPKEILDLLPGFKAKTGLSFIMHAEEKHREALYDLVEAAGLAA